MRSYIVTVKLVAQNSHTIKHKFQYTCVKNFGQKELILHVHTSTLQANCQLSVCANQSNNNKFSMHMQ